MPAQNLVHLEKYTPLAKRIMRETQDFVDTLHHKYISPIHLSVTIASAMDQEALIKKMGCKNEPYFSAGLVTKFFECYNSNFQTIYRNELLRLILPAQALEKPYLSTHMMQLMSFAEDKEKVTAKVLITELILYCRGLEKRLPWSETRRRK